MSVTYHMPATDGQKMRVVVRRNVQFLCIRGVADPHECSDDAVKELPQYFKNIKI